MILKGLYEVIPAQSQLTAGPLISWFDGEYPSLFIPAHPSLAWVLKCTPEVRQEIYPIDVIVNGEPLK